MEEEDEAWSDISLSVLSHTTAAANHRPLREFDLQDFFACPFNEDPPTKDEFFQSYSGRFHGGSSLPPPTTVLSLSSASPDQIHGRPNPETTYQSKCSVLPCSDALFSPPVRKRRTLKDDGCSSDGGRLKRLMKNRESGDKSRARKQVYIEELERESQHLKKENAKIKRLLEKLGAALEAASDNNELPKKHSLRRTLTAPF